MFEWSYLTTTVLPVHPPARSQNFFGYTLGSEVTPDIGHVTVPLGARVT